MWMGGGYRGLCIMYVSTLGNRSSSAGRTIGSWKHTGDLRKTNQLGGEELNQIIADAMSKFLLSNPLHPDVFPGVRKMEAELVAMCLDL